MQAQPCAHLCAVPPAAVECAGVVAIDIAPSEPGAAGVAPAPRPAVVDDCVGEAPAAAAEEGGREGAADEEDDELAPDS